MQGMTPLLVSLNEGKQVCDMVHLLISKGADVNAERLDTRKGKEVRRGGICVTRNCCKE